MPAARDPGWRATTNAMGEVPVLEVDGQLMSQSGAILVWLADITGKFAPDAGQRYEALRWIMFDNHKFTVNYAMHRFQNSLTPEPVHPAIPSFRRSRVEASCAIVDEHLANRPFMLQATCTIPRKKPASISRKPFLPFTPGTSGLAAPPG